MASVVKPCKKCGVPFIGKYCKPCDNARSAARRAADPERAAALVTAWKKRNPERVSKLNKASYQRNKESIALRARIFRKANRTRLDAYNEAYDKAHPEKRIARFKKHEQKNRDEISDRYLKSVHRLHKTDVPRELLEAMRIALKIKRLLREKK